MAWQNILYYSAQAFFNKISINSLQTFLLIGNEKMSSKLLFKYNEHIHMSSFRKKIINLLVQIYSILWTIMTSYNLQKLNMKDTKTSKIKINRTVTRFINVGTSKSCQIAFCLKNIWASLN